MIPPWGTPACETAGLIHASRVNCVVPSRLAESGTTAEPVTPSKLNACPTMPAANVAPPSTVPSLPSCTTLFLPSPGHQLTTPGGGRTHGRHLPALPALKMAAT